MAVCWGDDNYRKASPPSGERFVTISAGDDHTYAVRKDGAAVCWGADHYGEASPPENERFTSITSGHDYTCGLNREGTAICWGNDKYGQTSPPEGQRFVAISASWSFFPSTTASCLLGRSTEVERFQPVA